MKVKVDTITKEKYYELVNFPDNGMNINYPQIEKVIVELTELKDDFDIFRFKALLSVVLEMIEQKESLAVTFYEKAKNYKHIFGKFYKKNSMD